MRHLYTQFGSQITCILPTFKPLGQFRIICRYVDGQRDELIPARSVDTGETFTFEPKHFARTAARRECQHNRTFDRRHFHFGAVNCLVERDRQIEPDIVAVAAEKSVRCDVRSMTA